MFDKVVEWLEEAADGEAGGYSDLDVRTAVAALYYHMIEVDGVVTLDEMTRFSNILQSQFDLPEEKVRELVARGADNDRNSPGLFPFTVILNHEFSKEKRAEIVDRLAELADSDGHRAGVEIELIDHIRQLLKLDD